MKRIQLPLLTLLLILTLFQSDIFGQDYTRWNLPEGAKLRLGKGRVSNITFSPDGNRLIVESSIGIWVYDAHTGTELNFIAENPANLLGVSPYTDIFVSMNKDNIASVRNMSDGTVKSTLKEDTLDIRYVIFSPDENALATDIGNVISIWDISTGEQTITIQLETDSIRSVEFSPDGKRLLSSNAEGLLQFWDVATGSHVSTLSKRARLGNFVFSPDGNTLISGNSSDNIKVWDINTGEKIKDFNTLSVNSFAISPDGKTIATGGFDGLYLWELATGTLKAVLSGHHRWGIYSVAFSPDGSTLASGGGDELFLWDVESGARKMSILGHTDGVAGMALSPDGNILATSGRHKIHLWDATTGEYRKLIYAGDWSLIADLAFSPDGNTLASRDGLQIHLWDISSATHTAALYKWYGGGRISTATAGYNSIAFSPDGQILAAGNNDKTVHLWYMGRTYINALIGHTEEVTSIAFSRDNRLLVTGSNDQTVRLWDFATGSNLATYTGHTDKVLCVALNPDASIVASGSEDNSIILWDVTTENPRVIHTDYTKGVRSLAFSVDGNSLVSSSGEWDDPTVQIWDVATGELKATLAEHTSSVYNIIFSPDGSTLATGSWDGTVLLWDYTAFLGAKNEIQQLAEDTNLDGSLDLQDLIFVASQFGQPGDENAADVDGDGVINIADILLVAAALENQNGAPPRNSQSVELLTAAEVQQWLGEAWQVNKNIPTFQKGIAMLEQLLAVLTPKETVLLPNYPNPFNPETWIPYQLANSTDVTLRIYSADGHLVRTLALGNQSPGIYQNRSRAAYWDGKNGLGEPVASGVYFYTLTAGNFTATRRMVIRK